MSLRGAVGFADWGDKRNNKSSKNLLTKYVNGVNMNTTYERNYTMFTSAYELNRAYDSMHRVYGFAFLCSLSA